MHAFQKKFTLLAVAGAMAALVGCGGNNNSYLNISGVAATGFAIADGTVTVQCVSGTGTATTNANGRYAVTITNGSAPCLVTLVKDKITYRSITSNVASDAAVANVTPISEAIIQGLIAAKGAGSAEALITNAALIPSKEQITAAVTAVITKINAALVALGKDPLPENTDLLGKPNFVAATATTPSTDPLDLALDFLVLEGEISLSQDLIDAIVNIVDEVVPTTPTTPATGATGAN